MRATDQRATSPSRPATAAGTRLALLPTPFTSLVLAPSVDVAYAIASEFWSRTGMLALPKVSHAAW